MGRSGGGLCAALFVLSLAVAAHGEPLQLTAADYQRAEKVLDYNLRHAVLNAKVEPHWIGTQDAFWYRRELAGGGGDYWRVDAASGAKIPLFDAVAVTAVANAAAPAAHMQADHLSVTAFDGSAVTLSLGDKGALRCDAAGHGCTVVPQSAALPENWLISPDGKFAVFARSDNLWLRDIAGGHEKALTKDGQPHFAYGKLPDGSLVSVPALRNRAPQPPSGVFWLDGHTLLGTRIDERAVAVYPFVESVPQDGSFRPKVYDLRIPFPGDAGQYVQHAFLIDVKSGVQHPIQLPPAWQLSGAMLTLSSDHRTIFTTGATEDNHASSLFAIDVASGAVRFVARETSPKGVPAYINAMAYVAPNLRVLGGGKEAVWFSQADGWGHLYLQDAVSGAQKRQITSGPWLVRDLIRVDEGRRLVYFTATGREPCDPYQRRLYVASLDGGDVRLLTPEAADHDIVDPFDPADDPGAVETSPISSSGRYFVDSYSTVDTPPVTVLRATSDGHVIATIETADPSALYAAGWRAPQRFNAKGADGTTDVWGVIYFPPGFHKGGHYPVIDAFYGGPQIFNAAVNFPHASAELLNPVMRSSLAQLGFVVVTIDGRGTPGRSKAFHDVGYGNFADPETDDHVAAIKELASRFGGMDLTRVGVYGHSFGGYTSARAILRHPEFYKVAVASAGPHNYQGFYRVMDEFFGLPDYNGSAIRPTPQTVAPNLASVDSMPLAKNLTGHLMLVYGDMDENALPSVTLQMADALIKANKTFDLLYLPNQVHGFFRTDPYYVRRNWDYFVEHLLGATPPGNYAIKPPPAPSPPGY